MDGLIGKHVEANGSGPSWRTFQAFPSEERVKSRKLQSIRQSSGQKSNTPPPKFYSKDLLREETFRFYLLQDLNRTQYELWVLPFFLPWFHSPFLSPPPSFLPSFLHSFESICIQKCPVQSHYHGMGYYSFTVTLRKIDTGNSISYHATHIKILLRTREEVGSCTTI